jgi:HlyD family secretion protein
MGEAALNAVREPAPEPLAELVRAEDGKHRKKLVLRWSIAALVVAAAGATTFVLWPRAAPVAERFATAKVSRGDVVRHVSATGRVEARATVEVGAQVSGRIEQVLVDFDSRVHTGQVLARFELASFTAQLEQARAGLAAAKAQVRSAALELAEAKREQARARGLFDRGVIGRVELDAAKDRVDLAGARLAAARAQLELQRSSLALAQTTMDHTEIRAPIDGIVISREVDPGQTVAAAFQAPVLFVIAEDLRRMRVLASIDEADVGKVMVGQPATFTVDAYPKRSFDASVVELRSAPHLVQNVVTYDAILYVDNDDLALRPGMTASVEVETAARRDALFVPNGALHFQPPGEATHEGDAVWVVAADGPARVPVTVDITDGISTVIDGELHEDDEVIVELTDAGRKAYGEPSK